MKGWRRQGILLEPPADRAHEASVVKVQMRPVAKKLEMLVSRASQGFEHVDGYWLCPPDLRRNAELHG
jgi:hypothetical protein